MPSHAPDAADSFRANAQAAYDRAVRLMERRLRRRIASSRRVASGVSGGMRLTDLAFVQLAGLARPRTIAHLEMARQQRAVEDPLDASEASAPAFLALQAPAALSSGTPLDTLIADAFRSIAEEIGQPHPSRVAMTSPTQDQTSSSPEGLSCAAAEHSSHPSVPEQTALLRHNTVFPTQQSLSEAERFLRALESPPMAPDGAQGT